MVFIREPDVLMKVMVVAITYRNDFLENDDYAKAAVEVK